jgi:hypothetical protein
MVKSFIRKKVDEWFEKRSNYKKLLSEIEESNIKLKEKIFRIENGLDIVEDYKHKQVGSISEEEIKNFRSPFIGSNRMGSYNDYDLDEDIFGIVAEEDKEITSRITKKDGKITDESSKYNIGKFIKKGVTKGFAFGSNFLDWIGKEREKGFSNFLEEKIDNIRTKAKKVDGKKTAKDLEYVIGEYEEEGIIRHYEVLNGENPLYDVENFKNDYVRIISAEEIKGSSEEEYKKLVKKLIQNISTKFLSEKEKDDLSIVFDNEGIYAFNKAFTQKTFLVLGNGDKNRGRSKIYKKVIDEIVEDIKKGEGDTHYYLTHIFNDLKILSSIAASDRSIDKGEMVFKLLGEVLDFYKEYGAIKKGLILERLKKLLKEETKVYYYEEIDFENLDNCLGGRVYLSIREKKIEDRLSKIEAKLEKLLEKKIN